MKFYNLGQFFYWIVMFKLPEKNCPSSQVTNRAEYNFDENFLIFFRKLEKWPKYAKKNYICETKAILAIGLVLLIIKWVILGGKLWFPTILGLPIQNFSILSIMMSQVPSEDCGLKIIYYR